MAKIKRKKRVLDGVLLRSQMTNDLMGLDFEVDKLRIKAKLRAMMAEL